MNLSAVLDFDELPKVDGQPQGCAWGLFDKDGKKDLFGTLNLLTPQIVAAAAEEVRDGVSIALNWPLNAIKFPFNSNRKASIHFGITYNGAKATQETLDVQSTTENSPPTADNCHSRGGIVGRGVLIDFKTYFEETTGSIFDSLDGYSIAVEEIKTVAKYQDVEFKPGDILIVRTGYTDMMAAPTPADFEKMQKGTLAGVDASGKTARWVWNKRFAAVAGDAIAFESIPPVNPNGTGDFSQTTALHKYFLTQFGMPIGELWDLKQIASYTKKTGRYSFMLTSMSLNHPGLVASPPNAVAIL